MHVLILCRVGRRRIGWFVGRLIFWVRRISLVSIGSGLVFMVFGFSIVFYVSNVTRIIVCLVGDSLSAAVREQRAVRTRNVAFVITGLVMGVIVMEVVIFDSPGEIVWRRSLKFTKCQS